MKKESKQPKTSISVTKGVFSVVAVIAVLASIFCVTALNDNISFASQGQGYQSGDLALYYSSDLDYTQYVTSATAGTYFALARTTNSTIDTIYAFNANASPSYVLSNPNGGDYNRSGSYNGYNWKCSFYHRAYYSVDNYVPYLIDNSLDVTGKAEYLIDKLIAEITPQPSPSPDSRNAINVSLPAGNVAYINISGISNWDGFTASCIMPENSSLIGPPWWLGTSKYGFTSTLPTQGQAISGLSPIEWEKGNNGGVFGITSSATFSPIGPFQVSQYLVIYNPLYYGGTANGPYEWMDNPTINISVHANSVSVFPLLSSVGPGSSPGGSQVNTVIDGDEIEGVIDPETGEISWTVNDEESTGPQTGGANQPSAQNTINDWLKNIATQISGFFSGAIGAVNTLTTAISNFVGTLKALYMWLPSPVLSILTSAITLAITIGVIKVFI